MVLKQHKKMHYCVLGVPRHGTKLLQGQHQLPVNLPCGAMGCVHRYGYVHTETFSLIKPKQGPVYCGFSLRRRDFGVVGVRDT